jgi:integrase
MKIKLSDAAIRALRVSQGKTELLAWDEVMPGLVLRVGRQRRAWAYVYRPARRDGRQQASQKISLGAWPAVSVAAARQAAQIEAGCIARGHDPAQIRRENKRQESAAVEVVLTRYEVSLQRRQYAKTESTMRTLRRGLASVRDRDVSSLTRAELIGFVELLERAGKPGAGGDLRKHLRTLLEWTTNRGLTPFNVLAGLRRERSTRAQRIESAANGSALSDAELRTVWLAADPETVIGRYVRALILTGARRAELSRLHRSMDHGERLVIPPTHTKQGRAHEIPVVAALRSILLACPITAGGLVFASSRTGGEMKGWSQHVAKLRASSGVHFTLHDFRRTLRTGLTGLGVSDDIAEMVIGHQRGTQLDRTYDKDMRWAARVDAAERWAAHVAAVCGHEPERGTNVIRPRFRDTAVLV